MPEAPDNIEEQKTIDERAAGIGHARMEFAAHLGSVKKEVWGAVNDLSRSSQLIDMFVEADSDTKRQIKDELSLLLNVEWIREPDFDKLHTGLDFYDASASKVEREATPAQKLAGEYFRLQVIKPLLTKHKIEEKELVEFFLQEEKEISASKAILRVEQKQKNQRNK